MPASRVQTILSMKIASLLIIDLRLPTKDYAGGSVRGSLNIPAQGFYWNRGILYELAYKADIEWVVFTCGSCKEGSRGDRCARWFLQHVRETAGDQDMHVSVLDGGMKGWVAGGEKYWALMDGFERSAWDDILGETNDGNAQTT